jgi:DNA-binding transcriptional LysR family regulator
VERLPRAVRLTSAGRAMLPHARAALAEAGRVTTAARRATGAAGGELDLATLFTTSIGILPAVLQIWGSRHPGVQVRLFEHRRAVEMAAAMAAGQADLAIGPPPEDWGGPVRTVGTEEFVVVTHADDPVARGQNGRVILSDLAARRWVHFTPDSGLAGFLDSGAR